MFLPSGSQDDWGLAVSNRNQVLESFRRVITIRGYQEICTPVVDFADNFTNNNVGMGLQNMLKWFNNDGDIEVLRPDWTTSIARALVKHPFPYQKWAYQGSVFHKNRQGIESRQVGIEIIDFPSFYGESECLFVAMNFLNEIQINDFIIELGHTGIFEELASQLTLTNEEMKSLKIAMHDKQKDVVYKLVSKQDNNDITEDLLSLVDAYGSVDIVINNFSKRWNDQPRLLKKIQHLKKLASIIQATGEVEVIVDLGRVKNLPYYSGILFRGFLKNNGATCFSGGRYDKLFHQFDQNRNAVGLAFDVDILADQIPNGHPKEKICIIAPEESLFLAEKLRRDFPNSIIDVFFEKESLENYDKVLFIIHRDGKYEVIEK